MPPIFGKFGPPIFSLPGSWKMPALLQDPPADLRVLAEVRAFATARPGQNEAWSVNRLWALPKNGNNDATSPAGALKMAPTEEEALGLLGQWEEKITSQFSPHLQSQIGQILGTLMEDFLEGIQSRLLAGETVTAIFAWYESEIELRFGKTFQAYHNARHHDPVPKETEAVATTPEAEVGETDSDTGPPANWAPYIDGHLEKVLNNLHDIDKITYHFEQTTFPYLGTNNWEGFATKAPAFVEALVEKLIQMSLEEGMGLTADLLRQRIFVDKTLRPDCRVEFSLGRYLNDLLDAEGNADWQEAFDDDSKIVPGNLPHFWRDPLFVAQPAEIHAALKAELLEMLKEPDFDDRIQAEHLCEIMNIFLNAESPIRLNDEEIISFEPTLKLLAMRVAAGRQKEDLWDPTWREPAVAPPIDAWGFAEFVINEEVFTLYMGTLRGLGTKPTKSKLDADLDKNHLTALFLTSHQEVQNKLGLSEETRNRIQKRIRDPRTNPSNVAAVLWSCFQELGGNPEAREELKRALRFVQEFNLNFLPSIAQLSAFVTGIKDERDVLDLEYWTNQILSEGTIRRLRVGDQTMRISKTLCDGSLVWDQQYVVLNTETGSRYFGEETYQEVEVIVLKDHERVYYEGLKRLGNNWVMADILHLLDIKSNGVDSKKEWLHDYFDILTDFYIGRIPREEAIARITRFSLQHRDKIFTPHPFDETYSFRGEASLNDAKAMLKKIDAVIPPLLRQAVLVGQQVAIRNPCFYLRHFFATLENLLDSKQTRPTFFARFDQNLGELILTHRPVSPYDDRWTLEETEQILEGLDLLLDAATSFISPVRTFILILSDSMKLGFKFSLQSWTKALYLSPAAKKHFTTDFEAQVRSRTGIKREFTLADLEKPAVDKAFLQVFWIEVVTVGLEEYGKMVRGEPHDTKLMDTFMHLLQNERHDGEFMRGGEKIVAERTACLRRSGGEFIAGISGKKHFLGRFREKYLKDPAFRMTYDVISKFQTDIKARRQVVVFYVLGALISGIDLLHNIF